MEYMMIKTIKQCIDDPKKVMTFHGISLIIWILLIVPSILWWKDSISWVVFMSLYAIISTHMTGFQAGHAEKKADEAKKD